MFWKRSYFHSADDSSKGCAQISYRSWVPLIIFSINHRNGSFCIHQLLRRWQTSCRQHQWSSYSGAPFRYGTVDEVRSNPFPHRSQSRPVPLPRKQKSNFPVPSERSPGGRSAVNRSSGAREKDKTRTTRQDTGYSTASSASTRESPGNGKRVTT